MKKGAKFASSLHHQFTTTLSNVVTSLLSSTQANVDLKPDVTLNSDSSKHLAAETSGGVIATADTGRIVCDNTMKARLDLIYEELLPSIRAILFPEGQ